MSASEFILVVIVVVLVAVCGGLLSVLRRQAAARTGLEAVPEDVLGLRQEVAALRAEAAGALRHLSVVRYDAFGDMGGHLSWSLALADDGGDGVVLTSIHGRSDARTYAKTISGWSSDQQLSPRRRKRSPTHVRERAAARSPERRRRRRGIAGDDVDGRGGGEVLRVPGLGLDPVGAAPRAPASPSRTAPCRPSR